MTRTRRSNGTTIAAVGLACALTTVNAAAETIWVDPDTGRRYSDPTTATQTSALGVGSARNAQNVGAASTTVSRMADELRRLTADAAAQGAAEPAFIERLNALAAAYAPPKASADRPETLIQELFADGELARNPNWKPFKGAWLYDPEFGLRTARQGRPIVGAAAAGSQAVIDDAFGRSPTTVPGAHLIGFAQDLPNAVVVSTEITDHRGAGAAYLILHQGAPALPGYRVEIRGGAEPRVSLWRHGSAGDLQLASAAAPALERGRLTSVALRRTSDSRLVVRVDGRDVLSARDAGFRRAWRGFAFLNAGGDYSLREVTISESE